MIILSGWLLELTEYFRDFKVMFNKLINHMWFELIGFFPQLWEGSVPNHLLICLEILQQNLRTWLKTG